jgi:glucokinase
VNDQARSQRSGRCVFGIDIGGTKTLIGLFDEKLRLLDEVKMKTEVGKGARVFLNNIATAIESLLEKPAARRYTIVGVGVGVAGTVSARGDKIVASPNIPFLPRCELRTRLRNVTGRDPTFGNDCQLALLAEHYVGAAKGARSVIGVFLGSGVGGALIIDDRLHLGAGGYAGNLGQYLIDPIAPLAGSTLRGVLDDISSRTALSSDAARMAAKQWAPHLFNTVGTDVRKIHSRQLAEAIEHGDKCIEDLVRSRMRTVGIVLSNFVDFINPDMVLLGGGLVEAMPKLIRTEVKVAIKAHASPSARKGVKVVLSKLKRHAVTTGAAKLGFDRFRLGTKSQRRISADHPQS